MDGEGSVSIVVPTRNRYRYLAAALASLDAENHASGCEVIVIDDGGFSPTTQALARRFHAAYFALGQARGSNSARNAGLAHSSGELVIFVDDDVLIRPGWLRAYCEAAVAYKDAEVFGGPIIPRLDGNPPKSCGRESLNEIVTGLDLGEQDCEMRYAWGANMCVRRSAFDSVGLFNERLLLYGDETEWFDRYHESGGPPVRYVAAAALYHTRHRPDLRFNRVMRAAYRRGRGQRRYAVHRGNAPSLGDEFRLLARSTGHAVIKRCPAGLVFAVRCAGRVGEALRVPYA